MTPTPTTGTEGQPQRTPEERRPRLRASDADRSEVAYALRQAVAHGMLTLDECDERLVAAYGARFRDELPPLTADLPAVAAAPPASPGWQGLAALTLLQLRSSLVAAPGGGVLLTRPRQAVVLALVAALTVLGLLEAGDGLGLELLDD